MAGMNGISSCLYFSAASWHCLTGVQTSAPRERDATERHHQTLGNCAMVVRSVCTLQGGMRVHECMASIARIAPMLFQGPNEEAIIRLLRCWDSYDGWTGKPGGCCDACLILVTEVQQELESLKSEVGWECHNMSYVLGAAAVAILALVTVTSKLQDLQAFHWGLAKQTFGP